MIIRNHLNTSWPEAPLLSYQCQILSPRQASPHHLTVTHPLCPLSCLPQKRSSLGGNAVQLSSPNCLTIPTEKWPNGKNLFPVPAGSSGKAFVSELARFFCAYADGSSLEKIALKAALVACVTLLQRPYLKSKLRDNKTCLSCHLDHWKDGKLEELLLEGRSIQQTAFY